LSERKNAKKRALNPGKTGSSAAYFGSPVLVKRCVTVWLWRDIDMEIYGDAPCIEHGFSDVSAGCRHLEVRFSNELKPRSGTLLGLVAKDRSVKSGK
jgi:hypothetical protein